jgi:hypothetical protein
MGSDAAGSRDCSAVVMLQGFAEKIVSVDSMRGQCAGALAGLYAACDGSGDEDCEPWAVR